MTLWWITCLRRLICQIHPEQTPTQARRSRAKQRTFIRDYSGQLKSGESVLNSRTGKNERIGRLLKMHANKREDIQDILAGDICAVVGLKNVSTGDTICDPKHPITLESIEFAVPVISVAVEPKTKADQEKMGVALNKLAQEDPTFKVHTDPDSGQTIISGMGELHLEIIIDRMMREYKVEANVGKPQVAYRETIRKHAEAEGKYIRQTGGRGQYGHVKIKLDPQEPGKGYEFINDIVGGVVPKEYIKPVDQGIQEALDQQICELSELGLVERRGRFLRLTSRGRLFSNEVFERFISSEGSVAENRKCFVE